MAMALSKSLIFLLLAGVAIAQKTAAPSSAPTAAPTSAPTTAVGGAPTSAPTAAPSEPEKPVTTIAADPTTTKKSEPDSRPDGTTRPARTTAAPVAYNGTTIAPDLAPETKFDVTLTVAAAADFDEAAYLASMAELSNVPIANVHVKSFEFAVKVSYAFPGTVTEADVKAGAAAMAGVTEDAVTVTLTTARRLRGEEQQGRRLSGTTADVTIKFDTATAADAAVSKAADPAEITASIATATGTTVEAPTVATAPAIEVKVVTEIKSASATPVVPPTAASLKTKMEDKTGKTFTVAVSEPEVVEVTTAAAPAEGSASKASFTGVVVALLAAALLSN